MHYQQYLLLVSSLLPSILADRGTMHGTPVATCNQEPTKPAFVFQPRTTLTTSTIAKRDESKPSPSDKPHVTETDRHSIAHLDGRAVALRFSNCDAEVGGSWREAGFKTQEDVLRQAMGDAVKLAVVAFDAKADNIGFKHYFGGKKSDVQYDHFKGMMKAIAKTDLEGIIEFECRDLPNCSKKSSAMVTDASPADGNAKRIQVCPSFWTSPSTAFLLPVHGKISPSPPYRSRETWCEKATRVGDANLSGREDQWYATAGHTVLHELTHIDALAKAAGLSADEMNRHGTADPQDDPRVKGNTCELAGARNYLRLYKNPKEEGWTSPDYNAESYAAAATEIWFMDYCGFSQVRPQTKG